MLQPILSYLPARADPVYAGLSGEESHRAKLLLTTALSSWFDRAEDDLLFILGSNDKKCSRGQVVNAIKVNIINTFKTPVSSFSMSARVLRWVQCRFLDFAGALEAWGAAIHFPATITSLRRVQAIIRATLSCGLVKSPFSKYGLLESRRTWHPKIKSVAEQVDRLVKATGFRRPNATLVASLVARCRMFVDVAAASAATQEGLDLSESNSSWKEWVRLAGMGGAPAAHRFVKAPLGLGKFDFEGSQLSRADMLASEVNQWSGLWKTGGGDPPPVFADVPVLPPLLPSQLMGLCRLQDSHMRSGWHPPQAHLAVVSQCHCCLGHLARGG